MNTHHRSRYSVGLVSLGLSSCRGRNREEEFTTVTALVEKTCIPCRSGIPPLTAEEISVLHKQVLEWAIRDDARRIERTYTFKNFAQALT